MALQNTRSLREFLPRLVRERYLAKFAIVVVVALLVTTTAGVYFQGQVGAELESEVHTEMQTTAESEADAMHQWVEEYQQSARMLSEYEAMEQGGSAVGDELDTELAAMSEHVVAIHYVDLGTETVEVSTSDSMVGTALDAGRHGWATGSLDFQEHTQTAVSNGYESGGQTRIAFVSPVEGTSKAVMVVADASERALQFRNPIEGGYTQVVNGHGTVDFAASPEAALTEYRGGADADVLAAGRSGRGAVERDATGEVVGYASVTGTGWVVLAHAPQESAYALRQGVTRNIAALIGIALLGFVVIGVTIGRNTVTALERLADSATALSQGDLSVETNGTDRIDEIGRVEAGFSATKEYLQTIGDQADAMARQDFRDPAMDAEVPGAIGDSLSTMHEDIEAFVVELEQSQADAEVAKARAEGLAEELEQEATAFSAVMEDAAAGDLSQRLDESSDHRAMRNIATTFNEMLAQLEMTVVGIQEFADEVADSAAQVADGSEEVQAASQAVATSVGEISGTAEKQNENLQAVADEMGELSATIEAVAASADEVAEQSGFAAARGTEGSALAEQSIEQMDEIRATTTETVRQIEDLDDEMTRIGDIVDLIDEIADQTNKLALNASIEAARAGEAGEGFGVVASEIKSLAEETAQATTEIESLVEGIQRSTGEAAEDMREMRALVVVGTETIDESLAALDDIVDAVEDANTGVQSISDATDEQATSSQEVLVMVDDVSDRSNEVTAESQSVSAAAEEQAASVSQISDGAQRLTERSEDLRRMLDQFDTDAGHAELTDRQTETDTAVFDPESVAADGGPDETDD